MARPRLTHAGAALELTEISLDLGYLEISAFTDSFRRWTGVSPRPYRKANRAHGESDPEGGQERDQLAEGAHVAHPPRRAQTHEVRLAGGLEEADVVGVDRTPPIPREVQ